MLLARQTRPELRDLPRQELGLIPTAHSLLVQEPKALKANKVPQDQQETLELQVQPEQLVLLALKVRQVLMAQMVLMAQQAHKDRKALPALKVHKVIQD